jgi:hypothetical protein
MITTGNVQISQVEILSVTCDKCGVRYTPADTMEYQELYSIRFTGGYGSIFGDEAQVSADFCQRCLNELVGPYCRIE